MPKQVAIAHPVAIEIDPSRWEIGSADASQSIWRHQVNAPGAAHLSVVIEQLNLPARSKLKVMDSRGRVFKTYYSDSAVRQFPTMTPIVPGDKLGLRITTQQPESVRLAVSRAYVGTSKLGQSNGNKWEHAPSKSLVAAEERFQSASGTAVPESCDTENGRYDTQCREDSFENYACHLDQAPLEASRATVGLIIGNGSRSVQCTGTLVANTRQDDANMIATAAHCADIDQISDFRENLLITAYWGRVNQCGPGLESIFDVPGPTSSGYRTLTIVERIDMPYEDEEGSLALADGWLIGSDEPIPDGANPYWAGWNARNTVGRDRSQLGQADQTIGAAYNLSHGRERVQLLALDNSVLNGRDSFGTTADLYTSWITDFVVEGNFGAIGPGSSGSALFDQDSRLRGVASATVDDGDAVFFRLDLAWEPMFRGRPASEHFGESASGFKAFLDPLDSGLLVQDGYQDFSRADNIQVLLSSDIAGDQAAGAPVELTVAIDNATSCTRQSEPVNAEWDGPQNLGGEKVTMHTVAVTSDSRSTFSIRCVNSLGREVSRTVAFNAEQSDGDSGNDQTDDDAGDSTGSGSGGQSDGNGPISNTSSSGSMSPSLLLLLLSGVLFVRSTGVQRKRIVQLPSRGGEFAQKR